MSNKLLISSTQPFPLEISLYRDDKLATEKEIMVECMRLRIAFPSINPEFIALLVQMVVKEKMTKTQIVDSVDNLMRNFKYPHPTISDIIGWDKKVKLYTHAEVVADIPKGFEFSAYDMITINNEKRWIRK